MQLRSDISRFSEKPQKQHTCVSPSSDPPVHKCYEGVTINRHKCSGCIDDAPNMHCILFQLLGRPLVTRSLCSRCTFHRVQYLYFMKPHICIIPALGNILLHCFVFGSVSCRNFCQSNAVSVMRSRHTSATKRFASRVFLSSSGTPVYSAIKPMMRTIISRRSTGFSLFSLTDL